MKKILTWIIGAVLLPGVLFAAQTTVNTESDSFGVAWDRQQAMNTEVYTYMLARDTENELKVLYNFEDSDINALIAAYAYEPADAAIPKTDEVETITENWVNTANPWAANELVSTVIHESELDALIATWAASTLGTGNDTEAELNAKFDAKVNDTGNETIAGVKTFSSSPVVPTPTTDMQASTKKYVDDNIVASGVDISGTPVANDFARFTDVDTIEGRSYGEVKSDLSLEDADINALIAAYAEPIKGADDNFVTDAEKIVIGNTSGSNTGDDSGTDDQTASEVVFTPNGNIAATDVQAAIQEVRDEAGGGGTGSVTTLKENDVQVGGADIVTVDFLGADFDLAESPDTEVQVVIAAALTRDAEIDTLAELETVSNGGAYMSDMLAATSEANFKEIVNLEDSDINALIAAYAYEPADAAILKSDEIATISVKYTFDDNIFILESASADADVAGDGQLWVKNDTPNTLWFTDDAGTDFQIVPVTESGDALILSDQELSVHARLEAIADNSGTLDISGTTLTLPGLSELTLPNSAAPTVDAAGEIALDTTITNHDGLLMYYQGAEVMVIPAIPLADLTDTDGHIIDYNAAGDKFTMDAPAAGGETNSLEVLTTGIATTEIPIGTAADTVVYAPLSGDATMDNSGAVLIATDAITTEKIEDDQLDSNHYIAGSIDLEHMSSQSVDSDNIVNATIAVGDMAVNSIDSDQYVDGSIDNAHIADDQVNSEHYAAGSIDNEHLADNAADSDEIAAGAIDLAHMSVNSIDSDQYVDGSIDTAHIAAGTSVDTVVLDDETSVDIMGDADGMDDDEYNGIVVSGIDAGAGITQWNVVYLDDDTDPIKPADADLAGSFPAFGIAVASATDTNPVIVLTQGVIRNEGWTGLTIGNKVYLADTAGGLTQTAPSTSGDCVQVIGFAISDSEIYFDFSRPYAEVE